MFTGIVEELGTVNLLERRGSVSILEVLAVQIASAVLPGQSICVNGVCLTVMGKEKDLLRFEIIKETFKRTNLGLLKRKGKVNLERALALNGRLDGHFVTGHIDGTGAISKKQINGQDIAIEIEVPAQILPYLVLKGSLTLDGVSLTISALKAERLRVNLIPYTCKNTTLGQKKESDLLNIECDILAKHIHKFLAFNRQPSPRRITRSFLKEQGF